MTKAFSVAVKKTASWMGVKGKRFKKVVAEAVSGSSKVSSTARRLKRYVEKSREVPEEVIKDAISSVAEKENKLQSSLDVAVQKLDLAEQKAKLALQQKKLKTAEYEVKLKLLYKAEVEVARKELYTLKNRKSNLDCGLRARACDETDVKFLNASHYIPERVAVRAAADEEIKEELDKMRHDAQL
ncbi:unnamed protein product [Arabidopsis lyrata]|uniref:uncharacterized protein LOC110228141 n=1 Tax=Arabidopsis lyrata subsp. lyrata TaxID=81972 RepID=UPI000A29C4BA|nr:uncharacterized protein LOC110228141 [Arabidopsis lyrata subsp. lyrata]CAH8269206.1 unnamed protein product [Arabidopsis lyrata]|eukprot:XP_020880098.1 uncharacterized protein LOC110228141 [Arabidopsis lyrata subsp. lyrata]